MARKTPWQQALSQFVPERRAHPGGRRGLSPEPRTLGPGTLAKGAFPLLAIALAIALAAALAAGLLVLRPGGMAQAQDGETGETIETIEYAENGTDPVARFTATDPEGAMPIVWSVLADNATFTDIDGIDAADAADAEHFDISQDGVLTFDIGGDTDTPDNSAAPDFEAPRSRPMSTANTNTYRVVVAASDAAADAATGGETSYRKVAVMVTDVEENGEVAWSIDPDGGGPHRPGTPKLIQFQVGASLKASVTDGDIIGTEKTVDAARDDVAADPTWRWYRSPDRTSAGTMIDGANSDTYSVTAADAGMYLRAVAYYVVTANVTQETASLTSEYPVLAARAGNNRLTFSPAAVSREVAEGGKGMNAGAPVSATGNHGAVNYTLVPGGDSGKFKIDQKTGQITTAVDLDYDADRADQADNCRGADLCTVTVRATDASGDSTGGTAPTIDATVTIRVTDVDERPEFVTDRTGNPPAVSPERITREENMTALANDADLASVTYAAKDPEGLNVNLTLLGPDGDRFRLSASQVLSFREKPDYEMPADADRDNVYLVTVRASDGALHNDRMVAVTVQNVDEAPVIMRGGLSISGAQSTDFAENGTDAVATFTARGPMKDMASWTLEGADAMYFSLGAAMGAMTELRFRSAPDYEMPRGMARSDANTNTYMLTLKAGDGAYMAARDVTVMVANVDEDGMVTLPAMPPVVGVALIAALSDPDGSAAEAWQWARSRDMSGWTDIAGATMASYTPEDADAGHYLRAAVTYTDNHGPGAKTLTAVTAARVAANADALLVARYDTNPRNGMIDKAEVIAAINDYLFPRAGTEPITRAQVIVLINRYLGSG